MDITRQHETTIIEELTGTSCTQLLSIGPGKDIGFYAYYLEANNTWYRFFIEHGILFWDTTAPDPEDDLADDEEYTNIFHQFGLAKGEIIKHVEMASSCLTIAFFSGRCLCFEETADAGGTSIRRAVR